MNSSYNVITDDRGIITDCCVRFVSLSSNDAKYISSLWREWISLMLTFPEIKMITRMIFFSENTQLFKMLSSRESIKIQLNWIIVYICGHLWECVSEQLGRKQNKHFNKHYFPHEIRRTIQNANRATFLPQVAFFPRVAFVPGAPTVHEPHLARESHLSHEYLKK